jgi:WD40 repeat protein
MPDEAIKFYKVLELEPGAGADEIKQAYRDLAQIWHPDRFATSPRLLERAQEKMKELNEAYEFLKNYQPPPPQLVQDRAAARPTAQSGYSPVTRTSSSTASAGASDIWKLKGHTALVSSVSFSPNGRLLATGSYDKTVRIWQMGTGLEKMWFLGHQAAVTGVGFSSDNRSVLSGGMDNVLMLRDCETRKELQYCYIGAVVQCIAISPDGRYAVAGTVNAGTQLVDLSTGRELRRVSGKDFINCVAFSPRGAQFAAANSDGVVSIYERLDGRLITSFNSLREGVGQMIEMVAFSRDGNYLVTAGPKQVQIWHVATGRESGRLEVGSSKLMAADLMPTGASVATGHEDGTVRLWSFASGQEIKVYQGHTAPVKAIACAPDGHAIASGGMDKLVQVWRVTTGAGM